MTLKVFDLPGRGVRTLVNKGKKVEVHEVTFDALGLSSEIYVYRLTAGSPSTRSGLDPEPDEGSRGFVQTHKLQLLRSQKPLSP